MPIRRAVELIVKLARTVQYAHEHNILHRDIKPGNILLDGKGEPHLTDFGLARLVEAESTVTRTREVLGTPSYMAPEQAAGETTKLGKATDVYGLGAVFYQLLTGHPPFAGGTTYETIRLLLNTEPRKPRALNRKIDRDLSTICLKCLEKDPQRRYSSAVALAEDLEHWLKHEPIQARRTGIFTHARKWVRRNPSTTVLVTLLVALAVFPAAYFTLLRSPSEKAPIEKPGTTDLTAYNLYQRAQVLFEDTSGPIKRREKLPQAARVLDEAVARDPRFLLAWCLLSRVHSDVYWYGIDPTSARLDLANAAAQTALRLQPDAGEAHLALADYYYHGFEDYDRAHTELAIARRKLPNNATVFEYTGYIDRRLGHWEEATRNLERAVELLDPHNPHYFILLQELAGTYGNQKRYADQVRTYGPRADDRAGPPDNPNYSGPDCTGLVGGHQTSSNHSGHGGQRRSKHRAGPGRPRLCPLRADRRRCCARLDELSARWRSRPGQRRNRLPPMPTGRASSLAGRATQLRPKPPLPPLAKRW